MTGRTYEILDVFTETPFTGNPLAVVHDGTGLDDAAMQRIAREFNLSETVFLLPPATPGHTAAARIFTPAVELPFAGHPTVGAAVAIARRSPDHGPGVTRMVTVEERIGTVRCVVRARSGGADFAEFDLPRLPEVLEAAPTADRVARALGLPDHDIGFGRFPVSVATAGVPYVCVPVNGLAALGRARPDLAVWDEVFPPEHAATFLFTRETGRLDGNYRARMFSPRLGIPEDPATGSAVAAFAGLLVRFGDLPDGVSEILVEQGVEMGRPSVIRLEIELRDGDLHAVRLGGHAVRIAEGRLFA